MINSKTQNDIDSARLGYLFTKINDLQDLIRTAPRVMRNGWRFIVMEEWCDDIDGLISMWSEEDLERTGG